MSAALQIENPSRSSPEADLPPSGDAVVRGDALVVSLEEGPWQCLPTVSHPIAGGGQQAVAGEHEQECSFLWVIVVQISPFRVL